MVRGDETATYQKFQIEIKPFLKKGEWIMKKIFFSLASLLICAGCYLPKNAKYASLAVLYPERFMISVSAVIIGLGAFFVCRGNQTLGITICFAGVLWLFLA